MSRMIVHARRVFVLSVCATLFLSLLPAIAFPTVAGGGIVLRPPFDGTYRLTVYFDHYAPTYGNDPDGDVTIYTGETTDSCDPYCYRGTMGLTGACLPALMYLQLQREWSRKSWIKVTKIMAAESRSITATVTGRCTDILIE